MSQASRSPSHTPSIVKPRETGVFCDEQTGKRSDWHTSKMVIALESSGSLSLRIHRYSHCASTRPYSSALAPLFRKLALQVISQAKQRPMPSYTTCPSGGFMHKDDFLSMLLNWDRPLDVSPSAPRQWLRHTHRRHKLQAAGMAVLRAWLVWNCCNPSECVSGGLDDPRVSCCSNLFDAKVKTIKQTEKI